MEVNNGPLGPIVYNASLNGGFTVGIEGEVDAPFGTDEERRECCVFGSEGCFSWWVMRRSCAKEKNCVIAVYGSVFVGNVFNSSCAAKIRSSYCQYLYTVKIPLFVKWKNTRGWIVYCTSSFVLHFFASSRLHSKEGNNESHSASYHDYILIHLQDRDTSPRHSKDYP